MPAMNLPDKVDSGAGGSRRVQLAEARLSSRTVRIGASQTGSHSGKSASRFGCYRCSPGTTIPGIQQDSSCPDRQIIGQQSWKRPPRTLDSPGGGHFCVGYCLRQRRQPFARARGGPRERNGCARGIGSGPMANYATIARGKRLARVAGRDRGLAFRQRCPPCRDSACRREYAARGRNQP